MKQHKWKPPDSYCRDDLRELIDRIKASDAIAIEEAAVFVAKESYGLGHGRARARICRNLKTRTIPCALQDLLVQAISGRLLSGAFSEQFKDQLATAIRFRPVEMAQYARQACESEKEYIQRYGHWVLEKLARIPPHRRNAK